MATLSPRQPLRQHPPVYPGPAPKENDKFPPLTYYEIPIAIQDR